MDLPSQLPHLGSSPGNRLVQVSLDAVSCLPIQTASLLQSVCAPPTYQLCPGKANSSGDILLFSQGKGLGDKRNATQAEQLATLLGLYRVFSSSYNGNLLFPWSVLIGQIYNII